jgi:RNA polymerase sigma factor (sigma-70 family)
MTTNPGGSVLAHLRGLALRQDADGVTDRQLLHDFLTRRDEAAFAALVRRHGPMVLGVCKRVLGSAHDAEDAFQATFLVLVKKAGSVRPPRKVGSWLHGVAYRTALHARTAAARRRAKERQMAAAEVRDDDPCRDLLPLLDEELGRLPERYRLPLVLCELEGKTRKEAARQLGWPEGTVAGRLARARALLARRLARRGAALSAGALAALAGKEVVAAVPGRLFASTVQAAVAFAAGPAAGLVPAQVAALTEGVLKAMLLTKLKVVSAALLLCAALALTVGGIVRGAVAAPPARAEAGPPAARAASAAAPAKEDPPRPAGQQAPTPWKLAAKIQGYDGEVYAGAFSPDARALATGSTGFRDGKEVGAIKLLHGGTGQELRRMLGRPGSVLAVAFSPDGKVLASGGTDKIVTLWDAAAGQVVRRLPGHGDFVRAVAFSPDGRTLASGSYDRSVKLWDVQTGQELRALHGHKGNVLAVAFSPDGSLLASGGGDKKAIVWDLAAGQPRHVLPHARSVSVDAVAFSPDGRLLATGSAEAGDKDKLFGKVRLWDPRSGKLLRVLPQSNGAVASLSFSPDGAMLAAGSAADGTVHLWDLATGQAQELATGHGRNVRAAFSADGRRLATWSADKTVKIWVR